MVESVPPVWNFAIMEYCVLVVMCFRIVSHDGGFVCLCTDSRHRLSSHVELASALGCLLTSAHEYSFHHLIDGSALHYCSPSMVFQLSTCGPDDRGLYGMFDSGSIHDVPTGWLRHVSSKPMLV